jgi:hypothetical protein
MAVPGAAVPPRLRSPPETCARLTLYELVDERDGGHAAARDPVAVARRMSVDDARAVCLAPAGEALRAALEQTDDAGGDDPVVPVTIVGSTFDVVLEPDALADDALFLYVMVGWDAVAELPLQVVKAVVAAIDRVRGRLPSDRGGTGTRHRPRPTCARSSVGGAGQRHPTARSRSSPRWCRPRSCASSRACTSCAWRGPTSSGTAQRRSWTAMR